MSEEQYGIRQGGLFVAKVDIGAGQDRAMSEAMHYLHVYAQDGPAELWRRSKHRKWKRIGRMTCALPALATASKEGGE